MLECHTRGRAFVVTVHGEWDLMTAPAMDQMLRHATEGDWSAIAVDLADVKFMDIVGASPLRRARDVCMQRGLSLFLVHPPPLTEVVLGFCGLDDLVIAVERLPNYEFIADVFPDQNPATGILASNG